MVLTAALLALPAPAGDCRFTRPSCGYTPSYGGGDYYPNYYNRVLYPYPYAVETNRDFFFGVGDEYREARFAKLVAEELHKLQAPAPANPGGPPAYRPPAASAPPAIPPAAPASGGGPIAKPRDQAGGADPWCLPVHTGLPEGFRELVVNECAPCHVAGSKGGKKLALAGDGSDLDDKPPAARDRMFRAVANRSMPKKSGTDPEHVLTEKDLNLFDQYADLAAKAAAAK